MAYGDKAAILKTLANVVRRSGITNKVTIIGKAFTVFSTMQYFALIRGPFRLHRPTLQIADPIINPLL